MGKSNHAINLSEWSSEDLEKLLRDGCTDSPEEVSVCAWPYETKDRDLYQNAARELIRIGLRQRVLDLLIKRLRDLLEVHSREPEMGDPQRPTVEWQEWLGTALYFEYSSLWLLSLDMEEFIRSGLDLPRLNRAVHRYLSGQDHDSIIREAIELLAHAAPVPIVSQRLQSKHDRRVPWSARWGRQSVDLCEALYEAGYEGITEAELKKKTGVATSKILEGWRRSTSRNKQRLAKELRQEHKKDRDGKYRLPAKYFAP